MKYELTDDGIAKLVLDNGKVNTLIKAESQELLAGLERATKEAKAVVICGKPGMLSAGFDLRVVAQSLEAANEMFSAGFELLAKIYSHPQPLVVACEGHAIGMGVFILLAADYRVGAQGEFMLRLPETEIGMSFSPLLKLLAKTHIDPLHHSQAIIQSRGYDPETASTIGILDETAEAENVINRAVAKALELAALPAKQYTTNKLYIRSEAIDEISKTKAIL